jgi:hypothetical protein
LSDDDRRDDERCGRGDGDFCAGARERGGDQSEGDESQAACGRLEHDKAFLILLRRETSGPQW